VLLWPKAPMQFSSDWAPARRVRLGEKMAGLNP
jgi:hypothetical protein